MQVRIDIQRIEAMKVVHQENFPDWKTARQKEKYYKSGIGKEFLKSFLITKFKD